MKIKTVLKSLLLAYVLTGACLLLLAFLLFRFDLGETPVEAGIIFIYIFSCMAGGFLAGKMMRKEKYLWGILTGLAYFVLLAAVSFAVQGKWDLSLQHALTTFFICLGGGALGGMLS